LEDGAQIVLGQLDLAVLEASDGVASGNTVVVAVLARWVDG
jgi:hypothetical protein